MPEVELIKVYRSLINPSIEIPITEFETTIQANLSNPDYAEFHIVIKTKAGQVAN